MTPSSRGERARDLGRLTRAMTASARSAGRASVLGGSWLVDLLLDIGTRGSRSATPRRCGRSTPASRTTTWPRH